MPVYEVIGVRHAEYDRKSDHSHVNAYDVHLTYEDKRVDGLAVLNVFVFVDNLADYVPKVGDVVNVFYNKWGKVSSLLPVSPES